MVALNFNAQQVAPNAALEPVPSGVYDVMITASEQKPNSKNNGTYLQLELTIQGGEYNGRKLFDRLNTENPSAQAVEIAYGTLSAICHVTGRYQIQDSQQLHGVPFKAVVARVARDDKPGEYSNDVKGYKDTQGNDPGKAAGGGTPQGSAPGGGAPNWAGQPQAGAPQPNQGGAPQWAGQPQGGQQQAQAPQQGGGQPPQWAGGQQQAPNQGQGTAPPHQGAGGQQYPDPAHAPQQQPNQGGAQPPQWAGGQPQGNQAPVQQAPQGQPAQQPQQGFQPGASAPWGQGGPQQ